MEIQDIVDKAWQDNSWSEIADAPVDALKGVSPGDAEKLLAAFNIKTVRDFANHKFVRWAQEIVRKAEVGDLANLPLTDSFTRSVVETHYYNHWSAQYQAHLDDDELDDPFLDKYEIDRRNFKKLPLSVQESNNYYFEEVEQADWGSVRLYNVPIDFSKPTGITFFMVRTTTDGDDGWVEIYDQMGVELGIGRTYIELIGWGDRQDIRAMVQSGQFPTALDNRLKDTLWGK